MDTLYICATFSFFFLFLILAGMGGFKFKFCIYQIHMVFEITARFFAVIFRCCSSKLVGSLSVCMLAGEVISEEYSLEYGTDKIEMHVGAVQAGERALVIDDLIATGGTLCAAINLLGNELLLTFFYSS